MISGNLQEGGRGKGAREAEGKAQSRLRPRHGVKGGGGRRASRAPSPTAKEEKKRRKRNIRPQRGGRSIYTDTKIKEGPD